MSENEKVGRGFAGLDSLLSVVDDAVPTGVIAKFEGPSGFARNPSRESADKVKYTGASQNKYWSNPAAGITKDGKLFLGVGGWLVTSAIVGFIVIIFNSTLKAVAPQRDSALALSPAVPHDVPVPGAKAAIRPAAPPPAAAALNTEMPPVGSGLHLERSQIRYCLMQDARLNGIRSIINRQSNQEIVDFNASSSDFNSRCGRFRYRRETLASIRSEIESQRQSIEAEAQRLWLQLHPKSSKNQAQPAAKIYNLAPIPTRSLKSANPFSPPQSNADSIRTATECNPGYGGAGSPCAKPAVPQVKLDDAFKAGLSCEFGYRIKGNECVPITPIWKKN